MTRELPQFVRDLLASPPRAGEGVHHWLFQIARQLHAHLPAVEIFGLLKSRVANCGRHVSDSEIWDAIRNSLACAWQSHGHSNGHSQPVQFAAKWPEKNLERIEAICAEGYGLADLWEASPIRLEDDLGHTEEIIDQLFPGNPLLCVGDSITLANGKASQTFATKPREEWRGDLSRHSFIVPSHMSAPLGRKKNPKPGKSEWSAHTLDNTGARRFLVVECDFSIFARDGKAETEVAPLIRKLNAEGFSVSDMCAAVLLHLAQFAPIVCAVHSGGKSLHGWFFVSGQPDAKVETLFCYAVSLGADPATWTRSQFVRMPDGTRDNGKRQVVYFLSLKPVEGR